MVDLEECRKSVLNDGFSVVNKVYSDLKINEIIRSIEEADSDKLTFRKTTDLFAIRQFLKEIPAVPELIFNANLRDIITTLFGDNFFVVKSIYFDKPEKSNWFVPWHQDLTISVKGKTEVDGFGPWTIKHNQFAVQPPIEILEDNFTIRIHLDDTDGGNGALKVITKSHSNGISRPENVNLKVNETICPVRSGGIMIMKPLLFHASNRTINNKKRRVIHVEFSRFNLPAELDWSEKLIIH